MKGPKRNHGIIAVAIAALLALGACDVVKSSDSGTVTPTATPTTGPTGVQFTYTLNGADATITGLAAGSLGATAIDIPATIDGHAVKLIGPSAFLNRTALTTVTVPAGVTAIDASAFKGCSALSSVSLPEGLTVIADSSFTDCVSLESITIPSSVTSINLTDWAISPFYGCTKLSNISVAAGNTTFSASGGVVFNAAQTGLIYVAPGKTGNISIPDTVTFINSKACMERVLVTGLSFGSSPKLAQIGISAFEGSGLKTLTLPNTMTSLGSYAFRSCPALTSFSTGNGLSQIGSQVFSSCEKLVTFTFGSAVSYFNRNAFDRCGAISSFVVTSGNTTYAADGGVLYNTAKTTLERFPPSLNAYIHAFPATLTTLADKAFADYRGNTLEIPATVTTIGNSCFQQTYLYSWTWLATSASTLLGMSAFDSNPGLMTCTFNMTTPPTAGSPTLFSGYISQFRILVPSASVNAYKAKTGWSNYSSIIAAK